MTLFSSISVVQSIGFAVSFEEKWLMMMKSDRCWQVESAPTEGGENSAMKDIHPSTHWQLLLPLSCTFFFFMILLVRMLLDSN